MKIGDLTKIVDKFNEDTLPGILPPTTPITSGVASVKILSRNFLYRRDFCGMTKASSAKPGYSSSDSFVDRCLTLVDSKDPASKYSVCVGAVIDDKTKESPQDLPVVLAVGINYGQQSQRSNFVNVPLPSVAPTGMRTRLNRVLDLLSANGCKAKAEELNGDFHLVAANFFPWITSQAWSAYGFNSIEEAALIHCCGHASPEDHIKKIIYLTRPHTVVFHGANNAVPYLGGCVVRNCLECTGGYEIEVIFSDNVDDSSRKRIWNAIKLGHCKLDPQAISQSNYDQ